MLIIDLIIFIVVLSSVVIVHEFGHFFFAKKTGVRVEEFGIGFPPKLWKKVKNGTEYFIGLIPFGGLNKIYGMDEMDEEKDRDPHSYEGRGPLAKSLICLGGVFMNLVFAVLLFYILIASSSFQMSQNMVLSQYRFPFGEQKNYPLIVEVYENTPASSAGIKAKDIVVAVNGKDTANNNVLDSETESNLGKEISLTVLDGRTKETKELKVVLGEDEEMSLGIGYGKMAFINYNTGSEKALSGFLHSWNVLDYSFNVFGSLIGYSFENRTAKPLAYSMTGPVGIYAITKVISQDGWFQTLNLIAVLSLALAFSNLLPLPALDGAKFLFIVLGVINKKVFSKKLEIAIEQAGMFLLIFLAILIVFKDFVQFKEIIF
jgi:regulator of sigma E protease